MVKHTMWYDKKAMALFSASSNSLLVGWLLEKLDYVFDVSIANF